MTLSLTEANVAKLRGLLLKWPRSRPYALESEVRELVGKLCMLAKWCSWVSFSFAAGSTRVSCGRWGLTVDDERGIRTIGEPFVFAATYFFPATRVS